MSEEEERKSKGISFSAPPADKAALEQANLKAEQLAGHKINFSEFMRTLAKWALNDDVFWDTYKKEVEGKE